MIKIKRGSSILLRTGNYEIVSGLGILFKDGAQVGICCHIPGVEAATKYFDCTDDSFEYSAIRVSHIKIRDSGSMSAEYFYAYIRMMRLRVSDRLKMIDVIINQFALSNTSIALLLCSARESVSRKRNG